MEIIGEWGSRTRRQEEPAYHLPILATLPSTDVRKMRNRETKSCLLGYFYHSSSVGIIDGRNPVMSAGSRFAHVSAVFSMVSVLNCTW